MAVRKSTVQEEYANGQIIEEQDGVDADFLLPSEQWAVDFETERITDLLMHADDVEKADEIKEWQKDPRNKNMSVAGDDRSPPWTWISYLYHDGIHLAIPHAVLRAILRSAGTRVPLPSGGRGKKSFKELTQIGIDLEPAESMFFKFLHDGKQVPIAKLLHLIGDTSLTYKDHIAVAQDHGFDLFMKRARIGRAKHVRCRPIFRGKWSVQGRLRVTVREISAENLQRILQIGGHSCGMGDWRPNSPTSSGPFGRFFIKMRRV